MRVCSNGAPLISQPAADSFPPQGGKPRGKTKRLTPECVRGEAQQFHTSHGSTLLTATKRAVACDRCNGRARHSFLPNRTRGRVEIHSAFCILHSAFASGSGVVPAAKARRTLPASASLSGRILRLLLHRCRFDTGTISPGRRIVKVGN